MKNIFRCNKKNFLIIILVLTAASTGVTITAVFATCSTSNPFSPPYCLEDSSNGNAVRVTVDRLGNVGIGTTSPYGKLDIASGSLIVGTDGQYAIKTRIAGGTIESVFGENSGYTLFYDSGGTAYWFRNQADSATLETITDAGNVGIGTTSPAQKLEVNGMIQADGNLTTSSTNKEFKITAPSGVPICIGTGC